LKFKLAENLKDDAVDVGALVPVPPDGGYGWVIVFAAFLCNFLVDGIANAFGQFTKLYVETFQSDTATVAFVGSCLIGAYLLVGPVVSALTNKFGARIVVIVGSIISGIAFLLSILSPNIYVMIGLYGIGFGFVYLPAICVVCYYFEKKRSLATGIAVAGSGAGTIVMPPLCFELLKNFGYKITLAVLAGFAFTGIGMGILYRPLMAPGSDENKDVDKEMVSGIHERVHIRINLLSIIEKNLFKLLNCIFRLCSCFPSFQMLDFELLKNSAMILLSFSNLFGMLGFYVPFMFVFEMAKTKGIPEEQLVQNLILLVILLFFEGRIAFGWLADRKWLSALALNNISLLSCGVLTLISAYICLTSIVLTDLLGLDRLTNAFGILVVSRSIACFIGTPVAGKLFHWLF
uniref:MFS domain-containing protein n=1 Tax=Syphacia muris TaxID=451379 RepID=A0A0N5AND6_9BILA